MDRLHDPVNLFSRVLASVAPIDRGIGASLATGRDLNRARQPPSPVSDRRGFRSAPGRDRANAGVATPIEMLRPPKQAFTTRALKKPAAWSVFDVVRGPVVRS